MHCTKSPSNTVLAKQRSYHKYDKNCNVDDNAYHLLYNGTNRPVAVELATISELQLNHFQEASVSLLPLLGSSCA